MVFYALFSGIYYLLCSFCRICTTFLVFLCHYSTFYTSAPQISSSFGQNLYWYMIRLCVKYIQLSHNLWLISKSSPNLLTILLPVSLANFFSAFAYIASLCLYGNLPSLLSSRQLHSPGILCHPHPVHQIFFSLLNSPRETQRTSFRVWAHLRLHSRVGQRR